MKIVFLLAVLATAHCSATKAEQSPGKRSSAKVDRAESSRFFNIGWWVTCRIYCNNYVTLCFPEWMDPFHLFYPHCGEQAKFGPASERCQECLDHHGYPSSRVQDPPNMPKPAKPLWPSRSPKKKPMKLPKRKTTKMPSPFGTTAAANYTETTICKCKRVQKIKTVTVSIACSDITYDNGSCDISDPEARITATDESTCTCQDQAKSNYTMPL